MLFKKYNNLKKVIAGTLSVFMIVTTLAACGSDKPSNSEATQTSTSAASSSQAAEDTTPKPVTISISNYPTETDTAGRAAWDGYLKTLKEKYPYITVETDEYSYDVNTFFPKAASGQLPTLYQTHYTEMNKIIDAGFAADITAAVTKYEFDKEMNPSLMKIMVRDGKYYGVPQFGYVMAMMYNVKLWKEAGLVDDKGVPLFPKTWDEFAQSAQTIKQKTGKAALFYPTTGNIGGWFFMNFAWAYGTVFETYEDGKWKATFNSPEGVAALQFVKDLKWKYNVVQDNVLVGLGELFKAIGTDQAATSFGSFGWVNTPINDYKMNKDDIALSSLPAGPAGKISLTGGDSFVFAPNATPEQIDAGFKFFEAIGLWPSSTAEDARIMEESEMAKVEKGNIAGISGLRVFTGPDRIKMEDEIYAKVRNVNYDLFKDSETNYGTLKPEEPVNCQELYKTLDAVIQTVLTKKDADPKALLDKAAADFQKDYLDKVE